VNKRGNGAAKGLPSNRPAAKGRASKGAPAEGRVTNIAAAKVRASNGPAAAAGAPAAVPLPHKPARGRPAGRVATRQNILRTAIEMFAKYGYDGARIEKISAAAGSTDRMIYYYFGSKEHLFVAVLETIYQQLGRAEAALDLAGLDPAMSLRAIIRFTWNYYRANPEMLTLLNSENLMQGRHVVRSKRLKELAFPLLSILSGVLARGIRETTFRPDIDAHDTYIVICSLGYFYLSNRYTLTAFLGKNLMAPAALAGWPDVMEEVILRYVGAEPPGSHPAAQPDTWTARRSPPPGE
jgi:AcrR family transcriptional regulator